MSNLELTIDLLPKGAWGNNLRERLTKNDWDALRNIVYEKAGYRCAICGRETDDLEAHEMWEFNLLSKTQTLKDIVALCPACHGVKHFRNSERIGYGEQAKAHFFKINGCTQMTFARHFIEAQILFEERNKILRWTLRADLSKFGGNGIEIKERNIPLISNPYKKSDFATVKQIRTGVKETIDLPTPSLVAEIISLQPTRNTAIEELDGTEEFANYYTVHEQNTLPPKICLITVDNYLGTIVVVSDRVNKIQWIGGSTVLKTKYNMGGRFTSHFSVENLTESEIRFMLTGTGGATISQTFGLRQA